MDEEKLALMTLFAPSKMFIADCGFIITFAELRGFLVRMKCINATSTH
jgi:hypothetical protein